MPTGLSLALIFFIPQNASDTAKLIYAFVSYVLFTAVMFTIVGIVVSGIVTGLLAVPVSTLFADGIDYGEYTTNKRIEGMGSAITSFSQKISSGLAAASVGWILALTGYVAQGTQTAAVNQGITALFAWIPAVVLIVIFLILRFAYHYDEIAADVIKELDKRKKG